MARIKPRRNSRPRNDGPVFRRIGLDWRARALENPTARAGREMGPCSEASDVGLRGILSPGNRCCYLAQFGRKHGCRCREAKANSRRGPLEDRMKGLFMDAVDDLASVFTRVVLPDDPPVTVNEAGTIPP